MGITWECMAASPLLSAALVLMMQTEFTQFKDNGSPLEEVIERVCLPGDPRAGPRQSEAPRPPSPVLALYVLPTVPTEGAVPRMQP